MEGGKGWFIDTRAIKDPITQAKEMDRFNYRLLHNKVQALGGVPITRTWVLGTLVGTLSSILSMFIWAQTYKTQVNSFVLQCI